MITAASVKGKIQGLIDKANETTGNADTDLTTAVNALVEGYGSGGGNQVEDIIAGNMIDVYSELESFAEKALEYQRYVRSINMPKATTGGKQAFANCPNLVSASFPMMEVVVNRMFWNCTNLTEVNIPNATRFELQSFNQASKLCEIPNQANCLSIDDGAFSRTALTRVILPNIESIGVAAFQGCKQLELVDFGINIKPEPGSFAGDLRTNLFNTCSALKIVILRKSRVLTIDNVNVFVTTPFAVGGTGGRCFVPAELISQYQEATNWVTLYEAGTCTFLPLEEYTVDGTLTGEIDWGKLNALDEVTE